MQNSRLRRPKKRLSDTAGRHELAFLCWMSQTERALRENLVAWNQNLSTIVSLCRRSNNRLIYSRTSKALRKIFHEVLSVSATVEPRREARLSPLFQTGLRGQAKSAE